MYLYAPELKYERVEKSMSKAEFSIIGISIELKKPMF